LQYLTKAATLTDLLDQGLLHRRAGDDTSLK
jgi:hypothetical protein